MNISIILKEIEKQLEEKETFTEYGEPQAWVYLNNGRAIEVVHEEEGYQPEEQYFSVRLHCSEREFDEGYFADTCGIIESDISTDTGDSTDIDAIKAPLEYVLKANKNTENKLSFTQKLRSLAMKALTECRQVPNRMTTILNAEFALGKFYAILDILEEIDIDEFVKLAEESEELRDRLHEVKEALE